MVGDRTGASLGGRLRLALQLALAALLASAGGGLVLILLLAVAVTVTALFGGGSAGSEAAALPPILIMMIMLSGVAVVQSATVCWLPAFVAGAILRAAGRRHGWARRRPAWAAAGAAVAAIAWFRAFPPGADLPPFANGSGPLVPALAAAFLLAGAAAGQLFRSAMAFIALFFGSDEEEA